MFSRKLPAPYPLSFITFSLLALFNGRDSLGCVVLADSEGQAASRSAEAACASRWQLLGRAAGEVVDEGELRSVLDLAWLRLEIAPRGLLRLVTEDGEPIAVDVSSPRFWSGEHRPPLEPSLLALFQEGQAAAAGHDRDALELAGQRLLATPEVQGSPALQGWLYWWLSQERVQVGAQKAAEEALLAALGVATGTRERVILWREVAYRRQEQLNREGALEAYQTALELEGSLSPGSLLEADLRSRLGVIYFQLGDQEKGQRYCQSALDRQRSLAPGSLPVARSLSWLGIFATQQYDHWHARALIEEARAIAAAAEPGGEDEAFALLQLGILAQRSGDFDLAVQYFEQSLALFQALRPNAEDVAWVLAQLGECYLLQEDWARAAEHFRRALAIQERREPDSALAVTFLRDLGLAVAREGDLAAGRAFVLRGLTLIRKIAPGTLLEASVMERLGLLAEDGEDLAAAQSWLQQALAIRQAMAPDSRYSALNLLHLGRIALERDDSQLAAQCSQQAAAIHERLGMGRSIIQALAWQEWGRALLAQGKPADALACFSHAVDAVEAQAGRLGVSVGGEASYRARFPEHYRDLIDIHLRLQQPAEAFRALERSRAQGFLALLEERDLAFQSDLSPELQAQERKLQAALDLNQHQLVRAGSARDEERLTDLQTEQTDLEVRYRSLQDEIRRQSPRLAELQQPEVLDVAGAQAALDPGTVVLTYSVGPDGTDVFALGTEGELAVARLEVGEAELRGQVETVHTLLRSPRWGTAGELDRANLQWRLRRLYEMLVLPVQAKVAGAERLLIVPDGPLHSLPWGALITEEIEGKPRYLVEEKPLHLALSVSVFAQLRQHRRPAPLCGRSGDIARTADPEPCAAGM